MLRCSPTLAREALGGPRVKGGRVSLRPSAAVFEATGQAPSETLQKGERDMRLFVVLAVLASLGQHARAADISTAVEASEQRPCVANSNAAGTVLQGRTYRTWQEFTGVDYEGALRRVAQAVAANGWGMINLNKRSGVITAGPADGAQTPSLTVVVTALAGDKLRVEARLRTRARQSVFTETARVELCKLVEAAAR